MRLEPNLSATFTIDTSTPPLVILTMRQGMADEDYNLMFEQWQRILERRQTLIAITDASVVNERGSPKQRAIIADWTRSIEPLVKRYSKGHAVVVQNALVRGALTAVGWLHKTPVPEAYFSRLDEAVDWCVERLEKEQIPVPSAMRRLGTRR
jgi:hypothetical protein